MKVKFKNKVYFEKVNELAKTIPHPILIKEIDSLQNGNDRGLKAEFICEVIHQKAELKKLLELYYANQKIFEMFVRCDVYREETYGAFFKAYNNETLYDFLRQTNTHDFIRQTNTNHVYLIIKSGFENFKDNYEKVFDSIENKCINKSLYDSLVKSQIDDKEFFKAWKSDTKLCIATLFQTCKDAKNEEEVIDYLENTFKFLNEHAAKEKWFFALRQFIVVVLDEEIIPGIYSKYKLLFT